VIFITPRKKSIPYVYGVRRRAAILFLVVLFLAQTPVQQILKLPVLIEHYIEHRAANSGISFLHFIKLHYFSGNLRYGDYDRDQQLPFRANDVIVMSSTMVLPGQIILAAPSLGFKEKNYVLLKTTGLPSLHSFDIWQPPRSCSAFPVRG
jgi:hypothetical protein